MVVPFFHDFQIVVRGCIPKNLLDELRKSEEVNLLYHDVPETSDVKEVFVGVSALQKMPVMLF